MTTSPTPNRSHRPATYPADTILLDQPFTERDLPALRRGVAAHAGRTGLAAGRVTDLVLIVSELASNAIRHGGGSGRLRLWVSPDGVRCQVTDEGPGLPHPSALPRQRPAATAAGGRGLWLVLTFADTFTIDSGQRGGTVATATLDLPPAASRST
jgi:anti-sigma regulatory factor (Ser/Thr protein kinase)